MPAVSILVPAFEAARFLDRALASIRSQTFSDWEAVVVDNASSDGTFEVATEWERVDHRIRAYRNDVNIGPVRNWARCAALASGSFAGLLFADDWYMPGFVESALRELQDPDVGFALAPVVMVRAAGEELAVERVAYAPSRPGKVRSLDFVRSKLEARTGRYPVSPGCALMRLSDLQRWLYLPDEPDRFGWTRHGAGPDLLVYLRACASYPLFAHLGEPHVCFLAHEANLTRTRGVRESYAAALLHFYQSHALELDHAAVRARLWWDLRHTGLLTGYQAPGSVADWLSVGALAAGAVRDRIATAVRSARPRDRRRGALSALVAK